MPRQVWRNHPMRAARQMKQKPKGASATAAVLGVVIVMQGCSPRTAAPDPVPAPQSQRSQILAADGTELATLFVENRQTVPLTSVPQSMIDAVVAAEDQRFFSHRGLDLKAVFRAAGANAAAGKAIQGGSTITQQYVKNTYFPVNRNRTFAQKVREARLAYKLEKKLSKKTIMERYLNTVYFGDGAYGVQAASEEFFRKNVSDLTTAQSALLAGTIRGPETYSPRRHPELAKNRRDHIINRMVVLRLHGIDSTAAANMKSEPLGVSPRSVNQTTEPYFVDWVKQSIINDPRYGEREEDRAALLFRGGIKIHTSLDPHLHSIARSSIADILNRPGDPEAALVSIEPKTGRVVAMIGGRDYSRSQVNLALGTLGGGLGRQPGSSFKPFVLATALEDGYKPSSTLSSAPGRIRTGRGTFYDVNNSEGSGGGQMTLETATIHSVNAVFVRLGIAVGLPRVIGMARRLGVRTSVLTPNASLPLGTSEVSPLEMASAYGTFANLGINMSPRPITSIEAPGKAKFDTTPRLTRAIDPGVAYLVTQILSGVIAQGTGTRAQIGRPAAGKTGTTDDYADAWFVGYTPELVTAVWVGYPQGRIPMRNVHGIRVFGGTFPAMIWKEFMSRSLADTPPTEFPLPQSDLITIDIDPVTGLLAGPYCGGRETVQMLRQLAPTETCPSPSPQPEPSMSVTSTVEPSPSAGATPSSEPSPSASP